MALVSMERDPGAGFKKLNFLLGSGAFPRETFANLLLLYCAPQHGFFDLAADVMAENPGYCSSLLDKVRYNKPSSYRTAPWICATCCIKAYQEPEPYLWASCLDDAATLVVLASVTDYRYRLPK
jgi:hypothetical protein